MAADPRDPRLTDAEWVYVQSLIRDGIPADTATDITLFHRVGPDLRGLARRRAWNDELRRAIREAKGLAPKARGRGGPKWEDQPLGDTFLDRWVEACRATPGRPGRKSMVAIAQHFRPLTGTTGGITPDHLRHLWSANGKPDQA